VILVAVLNVVDPGAPPELFDCTSAIAFVMPDFQVELRNHDFLMGKRALVPRYSLCSITETSLAQPPELAVNMGPFRAVEVSDCNAFIDRKFASAMLEKDSVRFEGRLFPTALKKR
jgi:hypothetical protein